MLPVLRSWAMIAMTRIEMIIYIAMKVGWPMEPWPCSNEDAP